MKIEVTRDVRWFAERASEFLAERPERNVLATVLASVQDWSRSAPVDAIFALATESKPNGPVAAALRTPPWQMLATEFDDPADAHALLDVWLEQDPRPAGVSGVPATARAIAGAWTERTGARATLKLSELIHDLTAVSAPERPARGRLRRASAEDREQLIEWDREFAREARSGEPHLAAIRVDTRLAAGQHYVWDDDGAVSMLAHTQMIAGVPRIGPVYTPSDRRGRGYATSAVAALTQQLLDHGASRCMLFTDVDNPTSNHIYASIGYRPFAEWEVYNFDGRR